MTDPEVTLAPQVAPVSSEPTAPAATPENDAVLAKLIGAPAPEIQDKPVALEAKQEDEAKATPEEDADDPNVIKMRADYSRKTAELAERRKALEAKEAELAEREKALASPEGEDEDSPTEGRARDEKGRFASSTDETGEDARPVRYERLNEDDYTFETDRTLVREQNKLLDHIERLEAEIGVRDQQFAEMQQQWAAAEAVRYIDSCVDAVERQFGVSVGRNDLAAILQRNEELRETRHDGDWTVKFALEAFLKENPTFAGAVPARPAFSLPAFGGNEVKVPAGTSTPEDRITHALLTGQRL